MIIIYLPNKMLMLKLFMKLFKILILIHLRKTKRWNKLNNEKTLCEKSQSK